MLVSHYNFLRGNISKVKAKALFTPRIDARLVGSGSGANRVKCVPETL